MMDPNAVFRQCFNWFVTSMDVLPPKIVKPIVRQWPPTGIPRWDLRFTSRLFRGVTFASLLGHPITDKDTVDICVRVLNCTGLFAEEYKTWILQGDNAENAIDFAAFKSFWENAVQIAAFTSVLASQHGYSMVATNNDASASLTDAVSNFGTAYAATQESLRSNTANIMAIQGQLQMLCQAVGNGPPPPGVINYQQCPHGGRGRGQQRSGNNGGGGSYSGGGYNGGGGVNNGSGGGNQNANGGGGGYNGGNQNRNGGGGGYNGGGVTNGGGYSTGNVGNQNPSGQPPTPIKRFDNWNYCSTHGGDVDNNHTSATCARPGENHQRAATRTNTMGGSLRGMHKTILPSAVGRQAAPTHLARRPSTTHPPSSIHSATPAHVFP
jgi:hypothetical protein